MEEKVSNKFNVLDFLIAVLRQHEKALDKNLSKLEDTLRRLNIPISDEPLEPIDPPLTVPKNCDLDAFRIDEALNHDTYSKRHNDQITVDPLTKTELLILKLVNTGGSVEEIALRLDLTPLAVRGIVEILIRKGYLPPGRSLTKI
jgi:hypothetical protein